VGIEQYGAELEGAEERLVADLDAAHVSREQSARQHITGTDLRQVAAGREDALVSQCEIAPVSCDCVAELDDRAGIEVTAEYGRTSLRAHGRELRRIEAGSGDLPVEHADTRRRAVLHRVELRTTLELRLSCEQHRSPLLGNHALLCR